MNSTFSLLALFAMTLLACGCGAKTLPTNTSSSSAGRDDQVTTLGTVEVTASLLEVPDEAIFERDLYHYATVLKYVVLEVHRGELKVGDEIYVGHYDPWKPRSEAADKRAEGIGGNLVSFQSGDTHRMALTFPMDDNYMGGIVDKYFGKRDGVTYWALWTNAAN